MRELYLDNGCYAAILVSYNSNISRVIKALEIFFIMVHCIMVDCFHNSGKTKGIGFYRIPVVVTNQGEKAEELSRERRERWIAAISRDDITSKDVLSNERVCGRHFVSGQSAKPWDKYNVDWAPTLNLGRAPRTLGS